MFTKAFIAFIIFYAVSAQPKCPPDWYKLENKCYYVGTQVNTLYHNIKLCDDLNATLVSLHSQQENDLLMTILTKDQYYWIGLQRTAKGVRKYAWSDRSPVDFTIWAKGEPSVLDADDPWFTVIKTGLWHAAWFTNTHMEICQIVLPAQDKHSGEKSAETLNDIKLKVDKLENMYQSLEGLLKDTHGQVNDMRSQLLVKLFEIATKASRSN